MTVNLPKKAQREARLSCIAAHSFLLLGFPDFPAAQNIKPQAIASPDNSMVLIDSTAAL